MTWDTVRTIITIVFTGLVLMLILYTKHLEHRLAAVSKKQSVEQTIGMILCKILTDLGMSEQEIQRRINVELFKLSKERRRER